MHKIFQITKLGKRTYLTVNSFSGYSYIGNEEVIDEQFESLSSVDDDTSEDNPTVGEKERQNFRRTDLDFDTRFQTVSSKIKSSYHQLSFEQRSELNREMICLVEDFLQASLLYGRLILSERYIDKEHVSIKSKEGAGVLGGEKFFVILDTCY